VENRAEDDAGGDLTAEYCISGLSERCELVDPADERVHVPKRTTKCAGGKSRAPGFDQLAPSDPSGHLASGGVGHSQDRAMVERV
jgi:hypothetical protein